jgi:hypothetical protein
MKFDIFGDGGVVQRTILASPEFMRENFPEGTYAAVVEQEVPPPPGPRHITPLALLRRLTIAEEVALELSSVDNTSAGFDQRAQAAAVRVAVRRLTSAKFIDLDDPELATTLAGFEQAGLLGAGRAAEIVSAAVQPQERP